MGRHGEKAAWELGSMGAWEKQLSAHSFKLEADSFGIWNLESGTRAARILTNQKSVS